MNLSINEIAAACNGELHLQESESGDSCIDSLVIDSRIVTEGGAFLATVGERVDGHKFISQTFEKGIRLAITSKKPEQVEAETKVDCSHWGSYLLVEDTLLALKQIAEAYREKLQIPVVGITGSVGKTSTKEFIAGVLAQKYNVLKTDGNFNNEIGVPLTLLRIKPEHTAAVVEMGISDFGEMHRLSKMVKPDICVITNIGQCHLENLKTRDGILQAKSEIFDYMSEQGEICLNGEDDKLSTIQEIKGHKPHFFGFGGNDAEEVVAENIISHGLLGSEAELLVREKDTAEIERFKISVPLPGKHMVLNAAAACCTARLLGLTDQEIAEGIRTVQPVSGRNNLIQTKEYLLIDDCYNANPGSMKAAIDLLAMADTVKVAILGDMFELGDNTDALHAEVGRYAAESDLDELICVGENARYMYEAAKGAAKVLYFESRDALLEALQAKKEALLPKGCTVLLKASHGMEFTKVLEFLKNN